jgi:membrane-associated PAP2 superfamily phosphatase
MNIPREPWLPHRAIMLGLLLSAILLLAMDRFTSIDLWLEDWFFDPALNDFPWRSHWFAKQLAHDGLKPVVMTINITLIVTLLYDCLRKLSWLSDFWRWRMQLIAWASVVIPTVILVLKRRSPMHCPWSIDRYGGNMPYLKLFDHIPAGWQSGHCFPAGHASIGLWLAALAVIWLPHRPAKAAWAFACGLSAGLVLGWIQQMRGAHFLSHTLWSAWLASLVIYSLVIAYRNKLVSSCQARHLIQR